MAVLGTQTPQTMIHRVRHLPQSQFAQGDQVRRPKEIIQRALRPFQRINIATFHAGLQSLRSEIGHYDLSCPLHHPVRNGLAHLHSSELPDRGSQALDVLHVHGGNHVDSGVQQLQNVFITLAVLAALNVGVGQFVYRARFAACAPGSRPHPFLRKPCLCTRFSFEGRIPSGRPGPQSRLAAMSLHHADNDVLATAAAANALAQHLIGLSYARRVAQKKLEDRLASEPEQLRQAIVLEFWSFEDILT